MARDWTDKESVRADILSRMAQYGENCAAIPYCESQMGDGSWVIDIHVKVRGLTEFEIGGAAPTLVDALRRAYLALNNEPMILSRASTANATFGVAV